MAGFLSMYGAKCLNLFLNLFFLFLISCLTTHLSSSNSQLPNPFKGSISTMNHYQILDIDIGCTGLHKYFDKQAKCFYVKFHKGCQPRGYISYLQLFYCNFDPKLGHTLLIIWLILLFYLLGDTAAKYFCSSLEGLSRILKLSPTIAGVTLLSLGNGAPDLFASLVSFMGDGTKDVGLNSILGGAFFVSSTVVGIISITVCNHHRSINKSSFIRDVLFFLFSLSSLVLMIILQKINLWGALCFLSLYFIYVFSLSQMCRNKDKEGDCTDGSSILPVTRSVQGEEPGRLSELGAPLLGYMVDEQKVTISPVLLAFLWNSHSAKPDLVIYAIGGLIGVISGVLAIFTTEMSNPPRKWLLPWLAGGFLMSIAWTYILAQELVSLLVSLGLILGISPSILGLTVLAWGNSLGDLVANVTMAKNGGPDGAQVAISGCYAGAIFNILVGLGLSLVFSSWAVYPSCYAIPRDPFVYETMGFLMVGLLWALVILSKRNMRLDRFLGIGLVAIYLCFLCLKMARSLGLVQVHNAFPFKQ